jgi:hypothetical protein
MTIPATCPDFVSHPHIVNGRGCYTCQTSQASEEQGTSAIAEALIALGIPADVHQTGGFTMCVYIKTGEESYIYANEEGATNYCCDETDVGDAVAFYDLDQTPAEKAQQIAEGMKTNNLEAKELTK